MTVVAIAAGALADRIILRGANPVAVRKAFILAGFMLATTELVAVLSHNRSLALFFSVFSLSGLGLVTANY